MTNSKKAKRRKAVKRELRPDVPRARMAPDVSRYPSYLLDAALATGAALGLLGAVLA
ncbi:MAG: hypothetical protein J0H37_03670 [Hyphomicrobium denitrificans]|nr:hypothetical protein [Hyphomicrobium denitrificans]